MLQKDKIDFIISELGTLFPDAKCELNYKNIYELSIAVILSAQTTDKAVNLVTPELFRKYSTITSLAKAKKEDVSKIIKHIGMYDKKSEYIINFSKTIVNNYNGIVPNTIEELTKIPGVGSKTANVIVSEGYHLPGLAVDVHVARCANRLGLVNEKDPNKIEISLKQMFPKELWHIMHHRFIFMGRYLCKAKNPLCTNCPFANICTYQNEKSSL